MTRQRDRDKDPGPQQIFDWTRAKRQEWLDKLEIPPFPHTEANGVVRTVRTHRMTLFLQRIETFTRDGGAWSLTEERLRVSYGTASLKTIRRLVALCEARGLLIVKREPGRASSYAINWTEVAQILLDNPKTAALVEQPTKRPPQPTPDKLSTTPDNLSQTPVNLADTPDNLSQPVADATPLSRARGPKPQYNQCFQPDSKTQCLEPRENFAFRGFAGWPFKIEAVHLRNGETVQRLYEHALERGYVNESDRARFFRLARHTAGRAERGELLSPGGYFHSCVMKCKWKGSSIDEQAAARIIAMLDLRAAQPNTSRATKDEIERLKAWNRERQGDQ